MGNSLTKADISLAMSPLARVTKRKFWLQNLRVGDILEIIDGDDDIYAVKDKVWISMCGVPCVPVNAAARKLWRSLGWKI